MTSASSTMAPPTPRLADFEALVARERSRLERLARRLVWDDEEAKDVVQSAITVAWQRRDQLASAESAVGWLRRIVVHRAMSVLRRRKLWNAFARVLLVAPEPVESTELDADRRAHQARLAAALETLPARQSTAFSLRYLEGLTIDEVASALEIDRGTVRVHLQRAVKALRERGVLPPTEQP